MSKSRSGRSSHTTLSTSIAAAMLVAVPGLAVATDAIDGDADSGQTVVVSGKRDAIQISTVRGSVIDIPQVVSVVSGETLKQQQVVSLEQALRNVAGVTTQIGEGGVANGDQFFIRGQSAKNDIFTDGLRDFGAFTRDSFNYESIEVLKGSSSTALGRGVTGGGINTTSRIPYAERALSLNFAGGSENYRRFAVDGNVPINETSAFRVNAMAHSNDSPDRQVVDAERWGVAPSIAFGIGTDTRLTAIYLHQQESRTPDYGVPIAVTSSATDVEKPVTELGVDRASFYGYADTDRDDVQVDTLTVRFAHDFSETLSIASDTKIGEYDRLFRQSIASCPAATCGDPLLDGNAATIPLASISVRGAYNQTTRGAQNVTSLLLAQPLGSTKNEFLVGWDLSYQTNDRTQATAGANASKDLFNPVNSGSAALPDTLASIRDTTGTDLALFVDNRLWFTEQFSVNVGVRLQHFLNRQKQAAFGATLCNGVTQAAGDCFEIRESDHNLVSPKASLIWEPSDLVSAYVSYSRAAVPPGNAIGNGDALSSLGAGAAISTGDLLPEKTATFDVGLKASLIDRHLLVQTSVYQIDRDNATEVDPSNNFTLYSNEPKQRLRGFELGVTGALSDALRLSANYAYTDAQIVKAFTGSSGSAAAVIDALAIGKQVRYIPKHSASLWTDWRPTETFNGLEIGAGLTYQSENFLDSRNTQAVPSFVTFDALVAYGVGRYRFAVNGYNLADQRYYSQVNGGRVLPAAGRTVVANFGVSF